MILWVSLHAIAQPIPENETGEYAITAIDSLEHHYVIYASNNASDNAHIYTIITYKGLFLPANIFVGKKYFLTLLCFTCHPLVIQGDAVNHLGFGDYLWLPNHGYYVEEIIGLHYFQNQDSLQQFHNIQYQIDKFDNNMLYIWMHLNTSHHKSYPDFLKEKENNKKCTSIKYQNPITIYEFFSRIGFSDTITIALGNYQPSIQITIYYEYMDCYFVKLVFDNKLIVGWIEKDILGR
jgi:hypothetical protein